MLPFFRPGLPKAEEALTRDEQLVMLDAARDAGPEGKAEAAGDYIFLLLFEQRQGGIAFVSVIAAVLYGLMLPLDERAVLHLMLAVMSLLFTLVNANQAGVPLLGDHPRVSRAGKHVGMVFAPFWAVSTALNGLALGGLSGML